MRWNIWEAPNIEQTIMMVMQTVQTFAEAMKIRVLTEFEILMYEQCCNMVATFARQQDTVGRAQQLGMDRALYEHQQGHAKWQREIDANENHPDRNPLPRDEGSDLDGGGSGIPTE